MHRIILSLLALAAVVHGQSVTCDLYNGSGCSSSGPFSFTSTGTNNVPNSLCRRTYQLRINVPTGKSGYTCTFYMDKPEQNKYIYSIAESATATSTSSSSAFIYGYGLDARLYSKTTTSVQSSNFFWNNAHTHTDDNNYSYIRYTVRDYKVSVYATQGLSANTGGSYYFRPTLSSSIAYIGLNRRYASTSGQGSGLCKAVCTILS